MGAAVTKASALIVADYDPAVVRFAEINRALLAASYGREDYLTLRLTAGSDVWAARANGLERLENQDRQTLRSQDSWLFWKKNVRENGQAWSSAFDHFQQPAKDPQAAFAQTDYLFDDVLFEHLRTLAKNGHIWSKVLDLRNEQAVQQLCDELRQRGLKLGVVDTSNVPDLSEAGPAAAGEYVSWFSLSAEDSTLFLSTERANRPGVDYWSYYAFTGRTVKGRSAEIIRGWFETEIAKLKADPSTRSLVDDPDIIAK